MSFNGSLIKIGSTNFPLTYVFINSYSIVPNRRQELDSFQDANGFLQRNVLDHAPSTIELKTKPMNNVQLAAMMGLIKSNYINKNERKVLLEYYCPDTDEYQSGTFYVPDITFPINRVDLKTNTIHYNSFTLEFIEY